MFWKCLKFIRPASFRGLFEASLTATRNINHFLEMQRKGAQLPNQQHRARRVKQKAAEGSLARFANVVGPEGLEPSTCRL